MPFNPTAQNEALKSGTGGGISGAITHIGVHTAVDPGTGTTANAGEATGGSPAYARQAVTWGTAASGQLSNTNAMTFDVAAGTYGFLTFWTASTGNTGTQYRGYGQINGTVKGFFTVNTTLTADQFLSPGHGLANGDRVQLYNTFADSLSTGLTEGVLYFVVGAATDTFQVSTTSGGAAVDITAIGGGEGYFQKLIPETFGAQGQITVAAGAVVLDATAI